MIRLLNFHHTFASYSTFIGCSKEKEREREREYFILFDFATIRNRFGSSEKTERQCKLCSCVFPALISLFGCTLCRNQKNNLSNKSYFFFSSSQIIFIQRIQLAQVIAAFYI